MIREKTKEDESQLMSGNRITDTSNIALIKEHKHLNGNTSKRSIHDSLISQSRKQNLNPMVYNNNSTRKEKGKRFGSTISQKTFKEDEEHKSNPHTLISDNNDDELKKNKNNSDSNDYDKREDESAKNDKNDSQLNDNDNYYLNKDEDPFEKTNRRLFKREKICDTDTEDSASDNENEIKWIILPDCIFKRIWNVIISLAIIYSAIITPYSIAFDDSNDVNPFEYFIDGILGIDIILNFFCAYTDKDENLIKNHSKIIKSYLKSWFVIDFISVFPFSALISDPKYNKIGKLGRLSKLPKFYRLFRLTKLIRLSRITKKGNVSSLTKIFLEKLKCNSNIEKLVYFLLTFFLLSHLSTCIWYFVAKMEDLSPDSWVVRLGYIDNTNFQLYVLSFYWTLTTVTTVGYGDISAGTTPERIYNLFIMSFGVLMYSFAIGSLSSIVAALDQKTAEMNQKLQILASIKKEYHLDKPIYDKVRKVIKFDLSRNQRDKMQFLQELPNKLRIELSQIMHDKVIQHLNFFKDQPNDFFAYVAPLLKPVKFGQGDYLYKIDDMIDEMYFVSKGTIIFCLEKKYNEKEIKEIKKNNNFGEIEMCLTEKIRSNIKVKSRSSELFVLKKNDFLRLSVNFKEFIEAFLAKALIIYLRYNEERKKMIEEYEKMMSRVNPKLYSKNGDESVYNTKYTHEDAKEKDPNEKEGVNDINNEKESDSVYVNKRMSIKTEQLTNKISADCIKNKIINSQFTSKRSIINESPSPREKKTMESKADNHEFNLKFIKRIEAILDYLDKNEIIFPETEENPRQLLEQLKDETNFAKREVIAGKIEEILRKIYD